MSDAPRPPRRLRYAGKNPRRFEEKYKERDPATFARDVEKVLAAGKTPAGMHRPIMVAEILEVLRPRPGEVAVDCTLGYGGHARELLSRIQPGGRLLALDADPLELPKTTARLREVVPSEDSLVTRVMNYAGIGKLIGEFAPGGADIVLADLGLSSMQIDDPARGFSFKHDGPLDMRMNPQRGKPAREWLSQMAEGSLAEILQDFGDEPAAAAVARAILDEHRRSPLMTTKSLARIVQSVYSAAGEEAAGLAVRRVFQAVRIAVNDELGALEAFLAALPWCLKPGGRVAILTFHSGEDRRVKAAFKSGLRDGLYSRIADEVIRPTAEERRANPRSASAKLRWAVRG